MIFPTCVGVFLGLPGTLQPFVHLPHMRGGVSLTAASVCLSPGSSPHAWGCFHQLPGTKQCPEIFPTCVGVFLHVCLAVLSCQYLPHMRGGVSGAVCSASDVTASSPHAWGCFLLRISIVGGKVIFPTCVGVFLGLPGTLQPFVHLPHMRGGVSLTAASVCLSPGSSPHAWGCFHQLPGTKQCPEIFPTCVGCFYMSALPFCHVNIFPTCVGVFPARSVLHLM